MAGGKNQLFRIAIAACALAASLSWGSARAAELKVVWWNVEWGNENETSKYVLDTPRPLDSNLRSLIQKENPDVLAFGEYREDALNERTQAFLATLYPYQTHFYYGGIQIHVLSVAVFSRVPFKVDPVVRLLDWVPEGLSATSEEAYKYAWGALCPDSKDFVRPLGHLEMEKEGRKLHLALAHFANPWMCYKVGIESKLRGKIEVYAQIRSGHSPLTDQVRDLHQALQGIFSPGYEKRENLLLMGDFNIPRKLPLPLLGNVETPGIYWQLKGPLKDAFGDRCPKTFPVEPSSSAGLTPDLKIDHAFTSETVKTLEAKVARYPGSDHYPISVRVRF